MGMSGLQFTFVAVWCHDRGGGSSFLAHPLLSVYWKSCISDWLEALAIDSAWIDSCCWVCKAFNRVELSFMSASTSVPMPWLCRAWRC